MKNILKKKKNSSFLLGAFVILLIMTFVVVIIDFQKSRNALDEETMEHLKKDASQVSLALDYRVDIQLERMTTIGYTYQQYLKMNDEQTAKDYLQSRAAKYMFKNLDIIYSDNRNGRWEKYSRLLPFQRAMDGYTDVKYIENSPHDGNPSVLYAVPCEQNGDVKAILVGERTKNKVAEILEIERFASQGKYFVIDREGTIVTHSTNVEHPDMTNFYELIQKQPLKNKEVIAQKLKKALDLHETGQFTYELDNEEYLLNYDTIQSVDWILISMVKRDVLSQNVSLLTERAFRTIVSFEVLLIFVMMMFIRSNYKNRKELEKIAYVDSVTLGNTMIKFEELYNERMSQQSNKYAFITVDIDNFKVINDTFGSYEGDRTLRFMHDLLSRYLSNQDIIVRGQADIFYILKVFETKQQLLDAFQLIVGEINQKCSDYRIEHYSYKISISAGIYVIEDKHIPLISAVARSTVARKKGSGFYDIETNSCNFYTHKDREKLLNEIDIVNHMEPALVNEEFEVYLQPKMDTLTHEVKGAEALVRWNDREKGMRFPNEFIPIFEKTGFIKKVDLYVFEKCCQLVQRWIKENKDPLIISVNLSRAHFTNPNFLDEFIEIREKYQVPASYFEMEITETIVSEDIENLKEHMQRIYEAGFTCSLDDFGAGYSSLNVLKNIRADVIKLDKAFFREVCDEKGKVVIETIIELAKKLNMKTVAEGVETFEQVAYLQEIQCDLIQGFVFSKPIPISDFEMKYLK